MPASREMLYRRIEARVDAMLRNGLLKEAAYVYENRERFQTASQAIGYKEFFPYFETDAALSDCVARVKQSSRRYAKRQLTWFKRTRDGIFLQEDFQNVPALLPFIEKHLKT